VERLQQLRVGQSLCPIDAVDDRHAFDDVVYRFNILQSRETALPRDFSEIVKQMMHANARQQNKKPTQWNKIDPLTSFIDVENIL